MTTPRCLTEFDDIRIAGGRRKLQADLQVDLGVFVQELHAWDARGEHVWLSAERTTVLCIPAGTTSDYSSIPSVLPQWVVGRWDQHDIAGFAHDWLYQLGAARAVADRVWRIIARSGDRHVNPVQGWLGWAGIRVGGWKAYRAHARNRGVA